VFVQYDFRSDGDVLNYGRGYSLVGGVREMRKRVGGKVVKSVFV